MSKDLYYIVAKLLDQGLDEVEIASYLDVPVDMVEDLVQELI